MCSRKPIHAPSHQPGNVQRMPLNQYWHWTVCLLLACLTSQRHASVSQGQICSDNFTCSHTEIEVADQTFHLTKSQYTDTGPTSPSTDPILPGAWQGSHWSAWDWLNTAHSCPLQFKHQLFFFPAPLFFTESESNRGWKPEPFIKR